MALQIKIEIEEPSIIEAKLTLEEIALEIGRGFTSGLGWEVLGEEDEKIPEELDFSEAPDKEL